MDLAAFFAETAAAIEALADHPIPAVPVSRDLGGNGQVSGGNDISRISRISRRPEWADEFQGAEAPQAGAGVRAGAGARGSDAEGREQREQREQPAGTSTYNSRSPSTKREIERETGNPGPLPAATALADPDEAEERAAILEYEAGLSRAEAEAQAAGLAPGSQRALWRIAFARLSPDRVPCPGYSSAGWASTHARTLAFLDAFGEQAEALGWTALRLFSVHPAVGVVRVDACGPLVLPIGGPVRAITATTVSFGHLTHREKPGQPEGVLIWEFGR